MEPPLNVGTPFQQLTSKPIKHPQNVWVRFFFIWGKFYDLHVWSSWESDIYFCIWNKNFRNFLKHKTWGLEEILEVIKLAADWNRPRNYNKDIELPVPNKIC